MKQRRRAGSRGPRPPPPAAEQALKAECRRLSLTLDQISRDLDHCLAENARLEEALSRMNSLAALGQMAATVAHEIRNPLGGIAGFAGLLERDLAVEDPRRRWVKRIIEGVSSLNTIVTGLLNYTRPVRLNAHPTDIVSVVEESASFLEIDLARRDEGRIVVARSYQTPGAICAIDPEQIQQVLLNLLQNAAQAMPEGGAITVSVRRNAPETATNPPRPQGLETAANPGVTDRLGQPETEVRAGPIKPGLPAAASPSPTGVEVRDWIEVGVADTGSGMSEEVQRNLFTPFFTTKENGTGLGLATARKIVEAHRGTIRVTSEVGRGSTFVVAIPVTQ